MCDIAFLVMDLVSRQRSDLAYRFLNRYLEITGDYDSLELYTLYFVYRCLVRAKIAVIRGLEHKHDTRSKSDLSRVRKFCDLALIQSVTWTPALIVMHGLSGSGKTWLSTRLMSALPAVRIRSDIERKRMFDLGESANSDSGVAEGIYTEAANEKLYTRIHNIAAKILRARHDVIIDAAYLMSSERQHAREVAAECDAGCVSIQTHAPANILRDRIGKRVLGGSKASEANLAVLAYQLENAESLTRKERRAAIFWNSCEENDIDTLVGRLPHSGYWPASGQKNASAERIVD
jgi:predicted kinase